MLTSGYGGALTVLRIRWYRSLVSGSASHKSVTRQQSWILWSYYNDSVRPQTHAVRLLTVLLMYSNML